MIDELLEACIEKTRLFLLIRMGVCFWKHVEIKYIQEPTYPRSALERGWCESIPEIRICLQNFI